MRDLKRSPGRYTPSRPIHRSALSELGTHDYQRVYAVDVLGHADDPEALAALLFHSADYVMVDLLPHGSRHRFGPADLHPRLDHQRILPTLQARGELIRVAAAGENVATIWVSDQQHRGSVDDLGMASGSIGEGS